MRPSPTFTRLAAAGLFAVPLGTATEGSAAVIWNFEATVQTFEAQNPVLIPPPAELIAAGVAPGATISGSITIDENASDTANASPTIGTYLDAILEASFTVGDLDATLAGSGSVGLVLNDTSDSLVYSWSAAATHPDIEVFNGALEFLDSTGLLLENDQLLTSAPDLNDVDAFDFGIASRATRFRFGVIIGNEVSYVNAEIMTLSVPAPGGLLALLPWAARRRRRRGPSR